MAKEYKKVIIAIIVLVLIIGAGVFIYYQNTKLTPEQKELFSLPEGVELTQEQKMEYDAARTALEENPNDALALIIIAQIKYQVQDLDGAIKAYSGALEIQPTNTSILIAIAQIKYQVQDLDGAIKAYSGALEIQPTNTSILNNLGDIYRQKRDYEKSAGMYRKIIETNPKWINAYRELVDIYYYYISDKYPEMEELLLTGIEKNKEFGGEAPVDFYSMLAVFYDRTENVAKAIEYFEKVLELTPENDSAKIRLEELKQL